MVTDLLHRALLATMPHVPKSIIWRFSRRYIAGSRPEDAYRVVRQLNAAGCSATMDVLGEDSTGIEQVDAARDLYLEVLRGIHASGLDCGISVKLSEMGLRFDPAQARRVMRELLASASVHDNFVRIDMEDSSVTSVTLDIYRELRQEFANVGIVLQSCLRRTGSDVSDLLRGGPTNVRLCKGIYIEPEELAYRDPDAIRDSFRGLLERLFEGGATKVAIATHDPELVDYAEQVIERLGIGTERYEFQMLLGVAGRLRDKLVHKGHPLRVYVPFGELWFNYSIRRLRENPHITGHIVRNLVSWS